jgi:pimeloyl-ACP methyl ester carboxylesterase
MLTTTQFADGCTVHRAGAGPAIVCLPGFVDGVESWQPLLAALLDRYDTGLIELPALSRPGRLPVAATVTGIAGLTAAAIQRVWDTPVILVGHSLGSAVAVRAANLLGARCRAVVSIEGNLTADDAYFTGQAAGHDDPAGYQRTLLAQIEQLQTGGQAPASFAAALRSADAATIWALGRDVARESNDDRFGHELRRLTHPRLYLWSAATTSPASQAFLHAHAIPQRQLGVGHHWPWLVDPAAVAAQIDTVGRRPVRPPPR